VKTAAQLNREIDAALRTHGARRSRRTRTHHLTQPEAEASSDDLYMVAYDVLREYEPYKKLKQEKAPKAQELIKRFHRIRKEARSKYPDAVPPAQFTKLFEKLTKPDKTYPQAQRDILDNLAANGWETSPTYLKIPHATSPNGVLRLWFKPQAVWFTKMNRGERSQHGGTHNFKDARTMSYDLDIRKTDPDAFRDWATRSSELA
jgi:hypothetical protein